MRCPKFEYARYATHVNDYKTDLHLKLFDNFDI